MERLLLHLLIWLLKLVVQLVIFAATGKWYKFGQGGQLIKPAPKPGEPVPVPDLVKQSRQAKLQQAVRARIFERRPEAGGRMQSRPVPRPAADFPFEFVPELSEAEPESEDAALIQEAELAARRARARARAQAKLRVPAVPTPPRSLARAVRDKKTVRAALALGAALGPRRPRY